MEQLNYKELYENLLVENNQLKENLKKYTAPERNKNYYYKHKEKIIEKNKDKIKDPVKIKEYNQRSYQKRKEKLQQSSTIES
jgi:hypothetical protein